MENPILYVVLNKELKMSAGKAAAQAVHAAMMLAGNGAHFANFYKRSVIVLEAKNTQQLKNLSDYLDTAGIFSQFYIDEGVNEVSAFSVTALAVEPVDASDEKAREIFENLDLFYVDSEAPKMISYAKEAQDALRRCFPFVDDRPWFVRKTLKWLSKH